MAHNPTPGPWRVGYSTPNYRTESALSVLPGNAVDGQPVRPVCKLSPESSEDDEDRANAALIAAAPDLLFLLRGIQPGVTPVDWVSALLIHFAEHYDRDKDTDPDATATMRLEVAAFVREANNILRDFDD